MGERTYSTSEASLTLCDGTRANVQGMCCGEGAGKPWLNAGGSASPHRRGKGAGFP